MTINNDPALCDHSSGVTLNYNPTNTSPTVRDDFKFYSISDLTRTTVRHDFELFLSASAIIHKDHKLYNFALMRFFFRLLLCPKLVWHDAKLINYPSSAAGISNRPPQCAPLSATFLQLCDAHPRRLYTPIRQTCLTIRLCQYTLTTVTHDPFK